MTQNTFIWTNVSELDSLRNWLLILLVDVFNTEAHPFEAPAFATTSGKVVPPKPGFVVQSPDAPLPLISPHPMLPSTSRTGQ